MFFFLALYLSWGVLAICAVFIELDSCVITHGMMIIILMHS